MSLRLLEKVLEIFLPVYIIFVCAFNGPNLIIYISSIICLACFIVINIHKVKYRDGILIVDKANNKDSRYKLIFNTDIETLEKRNCFEIKVIKTDSSKIIDSQE
nr:MAG TPA: hypothetical protein [Caudoviricetes sp.]